MLTKIQKQKILNYLLSSLYATGMSSVSIGNLLRAFHFCIPFVCIYFLAFGSYNLALLGVIIILLSALAFILFKGCFMTKLETMLLNDGFTVVDPMLEVFGFDITYESRYYITVAMGSSYCLIFGLLFMLRFVWYSKNLSL